MCLVKPYFPEGFLAMAFNWSHQIAKRICNEVPVVEKGLVPRNHTNFESWKFNEILAAATSEAMIFNEFSLLARTSLLAALTYIIIILFIKLLAVRIIQIPEWFAQIDMTNLVWAPRVLKPEILEICAYVKSNRICFRSFFDYSFRLVASNRKTNLQQRRWGETKGGSMEPKDFENWKFIEVWIRAAPEWYSH